MKGLSALVLCVDVASAAAQDTGAARLGARPAVAAAIMPPLAARTGADRVPGILAVRSRQDRSDPATGRLPRNPQVLWRAGPGCGQSPEGYDTRQRCGTGWTAHGWSSPVVRGSELLAGTCDGDPAAFLLAMPATPRQVWRFRPPGAGCCESPPAVWDGVIFAGNRYVQVYAIGQGAAEGGMVDVALE